MVLTGVMDNNLITNRRREVEAEIDRLRTMLSEYEAELVELDTAGRVMARLSGAKRLRLARQINRSRRSFHRRSPAKSRH